MPLRGFDSQTRNGIRHDLSHCTGIICRKEATAMINLDIDDIEDDPEQDEGKTKKYVLKEFDSRLDAMGALYALRIVRNARVYRRVFERSSYVDDEIFELLGLAPGTKRTSPDKAYSLRSAIKRQAVLAESAMSSRRDVLARNIGKLGDTLRFSDDERRILHLAVITRKVSGFTELWSNASLSSEGVCEAIGRAVGMTGAAVGKALRPNGRLCRSGLFETARIFLDDRNPLELNSRVGGALVSPRFEIEQFLRCLIRKGGKPRLKLEDYSHIGEAELVRRYMMDASAHHRKGVNVLLYGLPGTGKTEFVRALAGELKLELHEVPNEDSDGDPIRGNQRFSSYAICQKILAGRRRQVILFDEVEDVFGNSANAFLALFGRSFTDDSRLGKSWTNEILETNPVPTIWVCNDIGAMDRAYLRRFDMVAEFRAPGPAATRKMIERYFRPHEISDACAERLSTVEQLPPAQIERVAKVVRSLRSTSIECRDREVLRLVEASMRAMDLKAAVPTAPLPAHYDPAFINADSDLGLLIKGLGQGAGARMCFYGPPGTGKTAFAHHLGRKLGQPVQVKRSSDLLDCYLGETEKKIANAFRGAQEAHAILVIDEADGFLRDRAGASRSWEVTQVNELLTQMEAFEGIFIASTNLVDTLDAASLRRFDFKVKFDYLTSAQRRSMLARIASTAGESTDEGYRALAELDRLETLTPGDFANVLRQLHVTGAAPTATLIVQRLKQEAAMKPEGHKHRIGFLR
ncbi:MAG: AAA family ATPase [Rhodanobacteraceae bacterium]|nr:MAG: AAA family ATPase [Rhodanobacteraceae bacterium]